MDLAEHIQGGIIEPHWMADGNSFWYVQGLPENTVIYFVDPKANTKKELFDVVRLRKELASILGHTPPGHGVPFRDFTFLNQEKKVEFNVEGKEFILELDTYTINKVSKAPVEETQPPRGDTLLSPNNLWIATIKDFNLWIRSTADLSKIQITDDGIKDHYWSLEQAEWSKDKMIELKSICEALYILGDNNKVIRIDNSQAGLAKAAEVLDYAEVTYVHKYDIETKRAWLVRQQINYLEKMNLIQKVRTGLYQVKPLGEDLINTEEKKLRRFYTQRIEEIGWAWGNIKYVSFLKKLLLLFPDKRISEKEFNYFVSHSHYNEELLFIFELISKFRNLKNKDKFIKKQNKRIKEEVLRWRTPNAYAHYLSKTRSLMKDLGYCLNFETKVIDNQIHLILS